MPVQQNNKKIKVLLVDDHPMVIEGIKGFLSSVPNIQIVADARDGEEAINKVRLHCPDIVLMDISMPGMNGIQATRILKQKFPEVKIIFLSMHDNKEYVLQFMDSGASGYILKRTTAHELVEAIEAVHNGEAFFSPAVSLQILSAHKEHQAIPKIETVVELNDREKLMLKLTAEGANTREIADRLNQSPRTVEKMRQTLIKRLKITPSSAIGLTKYAISIGLVKVK